MQWLRIQLHRCNYLLHTVQRRLRHRGAAVALMMLLVLGLLEPLACILHCDVFLPMVAASQRAHHQQGITFAQSVDTSTFLCLFGTTHTERTQAHARVVPRAPLAAAAETLPRATMTLHSEQSRPPADCFWCAPASTPLPIAPTSLHEMVLVIPFIFVMALLFLHQHVVALSQCPQCSNPPPLPPPLHRLLSAS